MKTITRVSKLLKLSFFIMVVSISQSVRAEVLTATIVIPPSTVRPDCHTYTGCGVTVVNIKKRYIHHRCKPRYRYPCEPKCSRRVLCRIY